MDTERKLEEGKKKEEGEGKGKGNGKGKEKDKRGRGKVSERERGRRKGRKRGRESKILYSPLLCMQTTSSLYVNGSDATQRRNGGAQTSQRPKGERQSGRAQTAAPKCFAPNIANHCHSDVLLLLLFQLLILSSYMLAFFDVLEYVNLMA